MSPTVYLCISDCCHVNTTSHTSRKSHKSVKHPGTFTVGYQTFRLNSLLFNWETWAECDYLIASFHFLLFLLHSPSPDFFSSQISEIIIKKNENQLEMPFTMCLSLAGALCAKLRLQKVSAGLEAQLNVLNGLFSGNVLSDLVFKMASTFMV